MDQKSTLELSLGKFEEAVGQLLEPSSLEKAFDAANDANFFSIGLREFFYKDASNGRAFHKEAIVYTDLMRSCLNKFQQMIINPELNGQRLHLDLYRQQMQWRMGEINRIYFANMYDN